MKQSTQGEGKKAHEKECPRYVLVIVILHRSKILKCKKQKSRAPEVTFEKSRRPILEEEYHNHPNYHLLQEQEQLFYSRVAS